MLKSTPKFGRVIRLLLTNGTVWSGLCKLVGHDLICVGGVVKRGRRMSERGRSHETWGEASWMVGWPDFGGGHPGVKIAPQFGR